MECKEIQLNVMGAINLKTPAGATWSEPCCCFADGDEELFRTTKTTGKNANPNWNQEWKGRVPAGTDKLIVKVKRAKFKGLFGGDERILGQGTLNLCFTDASSNKETKRVELRDPDTNKPAGEVSLMLSVKMGMPDMRLPKPSASYTDSEGGYRTGNGSTELAGGGRSAEISSGGGSPRQSLLGNSPAVSPAGGLSGQQDAEPKPKSKQSRFPKLKLPLTLTREEGGIVSDGKPNDPARVSSQEQQDAAGPSTWSPQGDCGTAGFRICTGAYSPRPRTPPQYITSPAGRPRDSCAHMGFIGSPANGSLTVPVVPTSRSSHGLAWHPKQAPHRGPLQLDCPCKHPTAHGRGPCESHGVPPDGHRYQIEQLSGCGSRTRGSSQPSPMHISRGAQPAARSTVPRGL
eukprot:jgi/Botrbrau1/12998/Bobra.384_1s0022.1